MSKHTPGPWIVEDFMGRGEYNVRAGDDYVAIVSEEGHLHNARLIAAAPELLDALKTAVARIKIANADGDNILSAWLEQAEAAINKAERGTTA